MQVELDTQFGIHLITLFEQLSWLPDNLLEDRNNSDLI